MTVQHDLTSATPQTPPLDIEHAFQNEPRTGRYCTICLETWHEPYAHKSGLFWHVPASNGAYYMVNGTACMCRGYHYRSHCRHSELVKGLEAQGKTHDLGHRTWVRYEQARWPEDVTLDDIRGSIG